MDLFGQKTLSQITKTADPKLDSFDFSKVIVNKPWGYEYLLYHTSDVSVWGLYIKKDASTSMHCHPNKKTSLLVVSGKAATSTLNGLRIVFSVIQL